jgi:aspartate carbamoyltransferase regulatory subunit
MNEILESHRKVRKCTNKTCISKGQEESTTRFTCWCCGAVLEEIKLK